MSLTPGPSTPGLVSSVPDNLSFCPVSITSGSGGISQGPLLQFSTCHQPVSVSLNAQMLPAQHQLLARNCGSRYIVNLTDSTNSEPYDQLRQ